VGAALALAAVFAVNLFVGGPPRNGVQGADKAAMQAVPFNWYIALDGHYVNSHWGDAGITKIEFPSCKVTTRYYPGISYGHAVDPSPDGRWLFFGNFSQQLVIVCARTMEMVERFPLTLIEGFSQKSFRLEAPTFCAWLNSSQFLVALPTHLWHITIDPYTGRILSHVCFCEHNLQSPHQILYAPRTRTIILADSGGENGWPRRCELFKMCQSDEGESGLPASPKRENSIMSASQRQSNAGLHGDAESEDAEHLEGGPAGALARQKSRTCLTSSASSATGGRIAVETQKVLYFQDDVWHLGLDLQTSKAYTSTYSKHELPERQNRSKDFGIGFEREYVYEICTETLQISRIFSGSCAVPIHLNSDIAVANSKCLIASGSVNDAFELSLEDFATWRTIRGGPGWLLRWTSFRCWWTMLQNFVQVLTLMPFQLQPFFIMVRVTSGSFANGLYALAVSPCERYICLGHRDYNFVRVVEAKTHRTITSFFLPLWVRNDQAGEKGGQGHTFFSRYGMHHSRAAWANPGVDCIRI